MNALHGDAVVRAALLIALFTGTGCSSSNDNTPTHATNLACDETTNPQSAAGLIAANDGAQNVNLDPEALADYQEMVSAGCAALYVGTATFKGDPSFPGCVTDERKSWPKTVNFRLCFKSPTSYVNCQNPDNDPAKPISDDEESARGIAFLSNSSVIGQVTLHTDHPFWDSVLHDSPAHFDQFAARAVSSASGARFQNRRRRAAQA